MLLIRFTATTDKSFKIVYAWYTIFTARYMFLFHFKSYSVRHIIIVTVIPE